MMKIWTAEEIKTVLERNDDQVGKALVKLYNCQTSEEQRGQSTNETNGVGFNKFDAPILSAFAEAYIKYGRLTQGQLVCARKRIMKYAKQLASMVNIESVA